MKDYIELLETEFTQNLDAVNALQQKAYMRNQFDFYGISAGKRREITKPFLEKVYLPDKKELKMLVQTLWLKSEREYQHFAMDLTLKYIKKLEPKDMELFEYMVVNKSWWDTVDMVAVRLMGAYFKQYPETIEPQVNKWLNSNNIWLQRSALLFQLKYKMDIDTQLLSCCINNLLGSKEFFINKAIGWVLREYSRSNPEWVLDFVAKTELHPLSKREALRLML
jgi:3-methyladenine DNA glycosylase AlkD